MKENFCTHCAIRCPKGTVKCPECRLRVRSVPRTGEKVDHAEIKRRQSEAHVLLVITNGTKLPPARVSAK